MDSRLEKIKKIIENNKNSEVNPSDLFNSTTEWASQDLSKKRYDICGQCPEFIKLTTQCKQCGCIMKLKTKLQLASCPIGKW